MRLARLLVAAVAAAALIAPGEIAAAPTASDVEGGWVFRTEEYDGACVMSGQLFVAPPRGPGPRFCTLIANEACGGARVRAEQRCTVAVSGGDVLIKSTVVKVTPEVGYAPDNFILKLESRTRMTGMLDSLAKAPVRFWRPADVPVS